MGAREEDLNGGSAERPSFSMVLLGLHAVATIVRRRLYMIVHPRARAARRL